MGVAVLTVGLVGCSGDDYTEVAIDDSSTTNSNKNISIKTTNSPISALAKEVYFDLDLKNYNDKNFELAEKMQLSKSYTEISKLNSEEELYNWVESNIDKTSFVSISEFRDLKGQTLVLKSKFVNKFEDEFRRVVKTDAEFELFEEEIKYLVAAEISTVSSGRSCLEQAERCIKRAQTSAAAAFALSAISGAFNPLLGFVGLVATHKMYTNDLEACQDAFDECINK